MSNITSRLNFTRPLGSTVMLGVMLFLSLPAATYAVDIIIDTRDPGASWSNYWSGRYIPSAYKGRALVTSTKTASSTFKFGLLPSGKYDVYMYWPNWSVSLPDNAVPVVIKHTSGTQAVTVNQQQNGGKWNRLGSWTLDKTAYLTLTNRGKGRIYSDAIKLVPSLGTPAKDPTLSLTANPLTVSTGGAATLSWTSQNTMSCAANGGWSGNKGMLGSETVNKITSSQTYNLTCAGTTKNVSATVKVAVISTPPPPPPPQLIVGINQQTHSGTFDAAGKAFVLELGVHAIRTGYGPSDYNGDVNWAHQNGLKVLFGFGYGRECDPRTVAGRQCYADRAASLAQKYGNKVQYYEMWNEWNGGMGIGGWPACQPTCTDTTYTDLLCRTYRAVKAVRPSAIIVGGVTAGVDTNFISKQLDAGAGNCMDMVSVHPYLFGVVGYNAPASVAVDKFIERITAVHNLVQQKTGKDMQVLASEDGRKDKGIASNQQLTADYITELFGRAQRVPFIEGIWWYELEDTNLAGWLGSGLVRHDNTRKPSFFAYQAAANK